MLRILILEDNETDADLINRELQKSGLQFTSKIVHTRTGFETLLEDFQPNLILSDYSMPSFDAATAFKIKQQKHAHVPFIIVSGTIGEENAVELIKQGVTDYISKQKLFTLSTKIDRALKDVEHEKERQIIASKLKVQQEQLQKANQKLIAEKEKVRVINLELSVFNKELEQRVERRTKALAESESTFRTMMETIPQIAWTNTIKGKVMFYNQRWYDYTGLIEDEYGLRSYNAVIKMEDRRMYATQFRSILNTQSGGEFQVRAKRADGVYRWHLIRIMPILDEHKEVRLWVGTATDIEELKQLQQHKDDFISIASHELKTPITSLKASLQLLDKIKHKPASEMLSVLIGQANRNLNKVNVLIEDLLNASLANEGQLHINQKPVNIGILIAQCCEQVRMEANYNIITQGDGNFEVFADAVRIEQIIVNFVNNAIKYAPLSTEILINIEIVGLDLKISVTDKGPGIDPNKLAKLFDRYYRVDHSDTSYNGLGLGLYISSEIIKIHHGQIGVNSEIGVGSTFWFTIPLKEQVIPALTA
ncbi:ATP-binding protein [Pedobacter sp. UYP24]